MKISRIAQKDVLIIVMAYKLKLYNTTATYLFCVHAEEKVETRQNIAWLFFCNNTLIKRQESYTDSARKCLKLKYVFPISKFTDP